MKRIMYASTRPGYPFFIGGDGLAAHFILEGLKRFYDWECMSFGCINNNSLPLADRDVTETLNRLSILPAIETDVDGRISTIQYHLPHYRCAMAASISFDSELKFQVTQFNPNLLVTAEENCELIVNLGQELGIPVVLRVNHAEWDRADLSRISAKVALVICVSEFIYSKFQNEFNCPTVVLPPVYDWDLWRARKSERVFVSMLNPIEQKGGSIFYEIAKSMPATKFMAQGGARAPSQPIDNLPNVRWIKRILGNLSPCMGLEPLLSSSKILLVPSQWQDAMPAIVIQAMQNGIPVIASRQGGIPEAIGDAGVIVDDFRNPAAWCSEISKLLADPKRMGSIGRQAAERALTQHNFSSGANKLNQLFEPFVKRPSIPPSASTDHEFATLEYRHALFGKMVGTLDRSALEEQLRSIRHVRDNESIGMLYNEGLGGIPDLQEFTAKYSLPLPAWVSEFQFEILQQFRHHPNASWNVGLIWSDVPSASLGAHFDSDIVYTLQLIGTKIWWIDPPNLDRVKALLSTDSILPISERVGFVSSETWIANKHLSLEFEYPTRIVLRPGDFLVMPAYSLHKVTSDRRAELTVSCNVGVSVAALR